MKILCEKRGEIDILHIKQLSRIMSVHMPHTDIFINLKIDI